MFRCLLGLWVANGLWEDGTFSDTYGELGEGFIEAHHTVPVSELKGERNKVEEIELVCSNCHRILHSGEKPLLIKELQAIPVKDKLKHIVLSLYQMQGILFASYVSLENQSRFLPEYIRNAYMAFLRVSTW